MKSRSLTVIAMVEKQSEIGRDAQLAMLLRHKWQEEIEQAISRVKKSRTRSEADRWFRKQWFRTMMRDRKKKAKGGKALTGLERRALEHPEWRDEPIRKH